MKEILHIVSTVIGVIGVLIIIWGVILITIRLLMLEVKRLKQKSIFPERETLRHQLGSYLLLGLEFMIAADIIGTFTHPTLIDMAVLGSIVLIRTVISYFLEREVAEFNPAVKEK
ncbi:MAG: DUF1622 domain-containing protein [Candidatus Cloacimonetes bacterium]|jgi:uncharacterized membrane protein|nr:DUF1622 domain-containing protein [Candidatus Cloacimonadota bacterium]